MNATHPEPAAVARREALDRRLGYKIKDTGNHDLAIFQWNERQGGWLNLLCPRMFATDDANVLTALAWAEESKLGHVSIFACCCFKCHTDTARNFQRTIIEAGGRISHGYWPACAETEFARLSDGNTQPVGVVKQLRNDNKNDRPNI